MYRYAYPIQYSVFTILVCCRDQAAQLLVERAERFWPAPLPPPLTPDLGDFNAASEEMDKSFHSLRILLDEVRYPVPLSLYRLPVFFILITGTGICFQSRTLFYQSLYKKTIPVQQIFFAFYFAKMKLAPVPVTRQHVNGLEVINPVSLKMIIFENFDLSNPWNKILT